MIWNLGVFNCFFLGTFPGSTPWTRCSKILANPSTAGAGKCRKNNILVAVIADKSNYYIIFAK